MGTINLICDETPELKLGPGTGPRQAPGDLIIFTAGFAEFDAADFPEWERWIHAPGTPHIEVADAPAGQVARSAAIGFDCPVCDKSFASGRALNGHRLSHRN